MWVFGVGQNLSTVPEFSYSKFSQGNKNKEINKVTHSNFEEGEIIIIENRSQNLKPILNGLDLKMFPIIPISLIKSRKINFKNFLIFPQKILFHFTIYIVNGNFICLNTIIIFYDFKAF